jgi:hypothetical protein
MNFDWRDDGFTGAARGRRRPDVSVLGVHVVANLGTSGVANPDSVISGS